MKVKLSFRAQQRAMRKIFNEFTIESFDKKVYDELRNCDICKKEIKEAYRLLFTMDYDSVWFRICNDCYEKHVKVEDENEMCGM